MALDIGINLLAELSEPFAVVVPSACKVHVTEDKHLVVGLVTGLEYAEVHPFRSWGIFLEKNMVHRTNPFICNFITAWNGNEHISEFLCRFHLVDSIGIGCNDFHSVRNDNTFQRLVLTHHPSIDSAAFSRRNPVWNHENCLSLLFYSLPPTDRYRIIICKISLKKGNGHILGWDIDNFTIMILASRVSENHYIRFLRCLAEHNPELHKSVRTHFNLRRHIKLNIQIGILRRFIAREGNNRQKQADKQRRQSPWFESYHILFWLLIFCIIH